MKQFYVLGAVSLLAATLPWISACGSGPKSGKSDSAAPASSTAAPSPQPGTATPAVAAPAPTLANPFSPKDALSLIYKDEPEARWEGDFFRFGDYDAEVAFAEPFTQGGQQKMFLLTNIFEVDHDCHACGVIVGAAVFSRLGDRWQLQSVQKGITETGSWGEPGGAAFVKIGPDRYGFQLSQHNMHFGVISSAATVFDIAGPDFPGLFAIDLGGNNEGDCSDDPNDPDASPHACWSYESTFEFVPGRDPVYFDILVTTKGTKLGDQGEVARVDGVERYVCARGSCVRDEHAQ